MSRELGLRAASGVVLAGVTVSALVWGGLPFVILWMAAGGLFAAEWLTMARAEPGRVLAPMAGACVVALALLTDRHVPASPSFVAAGTLVLMIPAALARGAAARFTALAAVLAGAVVAAVPPLLRADPGIGIVGPAWMFAVVWGTDVAAYFTGRALRGPKLMPRVSPNKTWSGALGGLVAATLLGSASLALARQAGWTGLPDVSLWIAAGGSALGSAVSQAGDLLESALKRRYGVKDSGGLIPGHGGVMDRLDGFAALALPVGLALIARHLSA